MPASCYVLDWTFVVIVATYSCLLQGGNPLDFRFVHVETVSVHSVSLTNQIEAQNVIR